MPDYTYEPDPTLALTGQIVFSGQLRLTEGRARFERMLRATRQAHRLPADATKQEIIDAREADGGDRWEDTCRSYLHSYAVLMTEDKVTRTAAAEPDPETVPRERDHQVADPASCGPEAVTVIAQVPQAADGSVRYDLSNGWFVFGEARTSRRHYAGHRYAAYLPGAGPGGIARCMATAATLRDLLDHVNAAPARPRRSARHQAGIRGNNVLT